MGDMTNGLLIGVGVIAALLLFIVWKLSTMRGGIGKGNVLVSPRPVFRGLRVIDMYEALT